jgi:predicted MFS family arabinose efflux permease
VARRGAVLLALGTTMLWTTGAFVLYTYIAPFLTNHAGISGHWLAAVLVLSGIGSAFGNQFGGMASDRFGPERSLSVVLTILMGSLLTASLVAVALPPSLAVWMLPLVIMVWSAGGWAGHPAQMSRLAAMAPDAAVVALSLNASALYFGIAAGAALGQQVMHHAGTWPLGFVGAACELGAIALLLVSMRGRRAAPMPLEIDIVLPAPRPVR